VWKHVETLVALLSKSFDVLCLARMVDEIMADLAPQTFRGQIEAMQSS
jgi:hypothetical protein